MLNWIKSYNLCLGCVDIIVGLAGSRTKQTQETESVQPIQQTQSVQQTQPSFLQQNPGNSKFNNQNVNQIRTRTEENGWTEMFDSSLNPSGMSGNKMSKNQTLPKENFISATNNPSAFNNLTRSDNLETFYQPIGPGGLTKSR